MKVLEAARDLLGAMALRLDVPDDARASLLHLGRRAGVLVVRLNRRWPPP